MDRWWIGGSINNAAGRHREGKEEWGWGEVLQGRETLPWQCSKPGATALRLVSVQGDRPGAGQVESSGGVGVCVVCVGGWGRGGGGVERGRGSEAVTNSSFAFHPKIVGVFRLLTKVFVVKVLKNGITGIAGFNIGGGQR